MIDEPVGLWMDRVALRARIHELEDEVAKLQRVRTVALKLFGQFDQDFGHGIKNGYWPELHGLYREAREVLCL